MATQGKGTGIIQPHNLRVPELVVVPSYVRQYCYQWYKKCVYVQSELRIADCRLSGSEGHTVNAGSEGYRIVIFFIYTKHDDLGFTPKLAKVWIGILLVCVACVRRYHWTRKGGHPSGVSCGLSKRS